jgi:HEAT repeat protein
VLFHLDGDRAVMFLDAIMNDPDPWLRIHVIEVIAAIADRRAPDFIARFLEDDDEMVREVAVSTLQSRGFDPATVTPGA